MNEKDYKDFEEIQKKKIESLFGSEIEYKFCEQEKGMINIPNDKPNQNIYIHAARIDKENM